MRIRHNPQCLYNFLLPTCFLLLSLSYQRQAIEVELRKTGKERDTLQAEKHTLIETAEHLKKETTEQKLKITKDATDLKDKVAASFAPT